MLQMFLGDSQLRNISYWQPVVYGEEKEFDENPAFWHARYSDMLPDVCRVEYM